MEQKLSLKDFERKAFTSMFEDGLWDIWVGCFLLIFVIAPLLNDMGLDDFWSSAGILPFWALAAGVLLFLRKKVVAPRMGKVKFGPRRKEKLLMANVIMAGVLGLGAFLATGALLAVGTRGKWFGLIYFSSLFLVLFWGAAYFFDFKRLYVYGLMASSSAFVGEWLYYQWRVPHHGLPVTFGIGCCD